MDTRVFVRLHRVLFAQLLHVDLLWSHRRSFLTWYNDPNHRSAERKAIAPCKNWKSKHTGMEDSDQDIPNSVVQMQGATYLYSCKIKDSKDTKIQRLSYIRYSKLNIVHALAIVSFITIFQRNSKHKGNLRRSFSIFVPSSKRYRPSVIAQLWQSERHTHLFQACQNMAGCTLEIIIRCFT